MTYSDKLRDPRWQKKRLKVMEYANWRCQICGRKDLTLHCHHSYYTRGKQPWQYPNGSIICICEKCHDKIHGKEEEDVSVKEQMHMPMAPEKAKESLKRMRETLNAIPDDPQLQGPPPSRFSWMRELLEKKDYKAP